MRGTSGDERSYAPIRGYSNRAFRSRRLAPWAIVLRPSGLALGWASAFRISWSALEAHRATNLARSGWPLIHHTPTSASSITAACLRREPVTGMTTSKSRSLSRVRSPCAFTPLLDDAKRVDLTDAAGARRSVRRGRGQKSVFARAEIWRLNLVGSRRDLPASKRQQIFCGTT